LANVAGEGLADSSLSDPVAAFALGGAGDVAGICGISVSQRCDQDVFRDVLSGQGTALDDVFAGQPT
jgi:hypothetical protein